MLGAITHHHTLAPIEAHMRTPNTPNRATLQPYTIASLDAHTTTT